jgi:hypothetical protein
MERVTASELANRIKEWPRGRDAFTNSRVTDAVRDSLRHAETLGLVYSAPHPRHPGWTVWAVSPVLEG